MSASNGSTHDEVINRRFLVADDDPIMREMMHAHLASEATTVVCVGNGREAWERLSRETFDLAVVDLGMPELDGFGLISHLRQTPRTIDLPIIVATGRDDSEAIERAFAAGATSFVTKPVNWPLFAYQVRFVLRSGAIEHDLRQARVAADIASRTKDSLFHLLGHELRTPLNVLMGFAGVLERELADKLSEEQRRHMRDMTAAARDLNEIVGNVLTYSRLFGGDHSLRKESVDIRELLDNAASKLKVKSKAKNVLLIVRQLPVPISVQGDNRWLTDALTRLVDNAIKFSSAGGTVDLMPMLQEDGSLALTVRDNGPGMDLRKLDEYLQPFFQADMTFTRQAEGLGMGLPIARKIIEMHGGKLIFRSAPGQGTVAALWLPACACSHDAMARSA